MEINLFTGAERGFLGGHLKKNITGSNIDYGDILNYKKACCSNLFHFAGSSDDFDFNDQEKTVNSIVIGTMNMLKIAKENNAKFIFASTKGVESPNNVYCYSKLLMEKFIQENYENWIILRIPRVYDKTRKKGLMKKIRLNLIPDHDMANKIEFLTLSNFIEQTLKVVNKKNIIYNYYNLHCNTISNIKKLYT